MSSADEAIIRLSKDICRLEMMLYKLSNELGYVLDCTDGGPFPIALIRKVCRECGK